MYHLFRRLRPFLWLFRLVVVVQAANWILAGLREERPIHSAHWGFLVIGYFLLSLLTDWLLRFRRPLLSDLEPDRNALKIYISRSYLIPILPFLALPTVYLILWPRPVDWLDTVQHILVVSLVLLVLFSIINQLFLNLYFLAVNDRARKIALVREVKAKSPETLDLYGAALAQNYTELATYRAFALYERKVIAYDEYGHTTVLKYRALAEVKQLLANDERFFMKGSWILRYDALDRQEIIAETRGRKLYLKNTANYFTLNKNDVGTFLDWLERANRNWSMRHE